MKTFEEITPNSQQANTIELRFNAMTLSDGDHERVKRGREEKIKVLAREAHLVLEFENGPVGFGRMLEQEMCSTSSCRAASRSSARSSARRNSART